MCIIKKSPSQWTLLYQPEQDIGFLLDVLWAIALYVNYAPNPPKVPFV